MQTKRTATDAPEYLTELAAKVLPALEQIAETARTNLGNPAIGLDALASINQATSEKVAKTLRDIREGRELDCLNLMREPAIARL